MMGVLVRNLKHLVYSNERLYVYIKTVHWYLSVVPQRHLSMNPSYTDWCSPEKYE